MRLTLRRVEIFPAMSEETTAFTARLYDLDEPLAGRAWIATVRNDGRGGMHRIDWRGDMAGNRLHAEATARTDPRARAFCEAVGGSWDGKRRSGAEALDILVDALLS